LVVSKLHTSIIIPAFALGAAFSCAGNLRLLSILHFRRLPGLGLRPARVAEPRVEPREHRVCVGGVSSLEAEKGVVLDARLPQALGYLVVLAQETHCLLMRVKLATKSWANYEMRVKLATKSWAKFEMLVKLATKSWAKYEMRVKLATKSWAV